MKKPIIEVEVFESGSYAVKQNREIKTDEDIEEFKELIECNSK